MPTKKPQSLQMTVVPQQSMSRKEKDEMFIHALRHPRLFDEVIRRLVAVKHFDYSTQPEYVVLLRAYQEVKKKHDTKPGDPSFQPRLKVEIKDILAAAGDEILPKEKSQILGSKGILARAFSGKTKATTETYGMALLRRFLLEKEVYHPLANVFTQCQKEKHLPENIGEMLSQAQQRWSAIQSLDLPVIQSVGEKWSEHEERLKFFRGREIIGFRTGLKELDRRTIGLRGLTIFGAKPGVGKTALGVEMALGICRHHPENDAVVIVVSLDMEEFELYPRVQCNLSNMDWNVLMFGSAKEDRELGSVFSAADWKRIEAGKQRLKAEQVDRRLVILDRSILGDDITAQRLTAMIEATKAKVNAKRALLIVDYLQLLPVPDDVANRGDLSADKFRVRMLQDVIKGTRTTENPLGDAVLAVSEARKPSTSKDPWGQSLSELMGTARVGYAPTAVLLYRPMSPKELAHYYDSPIGSAEQAEKHRQKLIDAGIAPLMLILEKGRDGMIRGEWGVEFHFRKTQFRELKENGGTKLSKYGKGLPPHLQILAPPEADQTAKGAATALPPVGIGHAKASKKSSKPAKPNEGMPNGNGKSTTSKTKNKKA
jgi:hypothetical protein